LLLVVAGANRAIAADTPPAEGSKAYQQAVERAVDFLRAKGQQADGSFSPQVGTGVTALVTFSLLRNGRTAEDPVVAKGLAYLEKFVQPDGGIYLKDGFQPNYETCLGVLCFSAVNGDHRYDKLVKNADKYLKAAQWGETPAADRSEPTWGGAGYGKHKRPDLSNTAFLVEALRAAGNSPDDEAVKRALVFVSRCQNLESEANTTKFAAKVNDGGFYYTPAAGGESFAGKTPEGGLRSYGSMTYAGLKSMLYAGVGPNDPRVKAAHKWISAHFDVTSNPGLGKAGLYYYYHLFAKALDALGEKEITDSSGVKHDWRKELRIELLRRQRPDGSWVNEETKWLEGDPSLVTAYALMSLAYCRP
jgi:squalene-hopene/tetraprenyl-beta-curcumene cyclase